MKENKNSAMDSAFAITKTAKQKLGKQAEDSVMPADFTIPQIDTSQETKRPMVDWPGASQSTYCMTRVCNTWNQVLSNLRTAILIFMTFRDMAFNSETQGDWIGWFGTYDDLINRREGQYRIRIMESQIMWFLFVLNRKKWMQSMQKWWKAKKHN